MTQNMGEAIGWDTSRIENPDEGGTYTILPAGEYPFTVVKFERGQFEGSDKMCRCPKAIVTCEIDAGELGTTNVITNLFLNKKSEWVLCRFFTAIGLRQHGDGLLLAWDRIVGCSGRCEIGHRTYNGTQYNEIKKFLDPPPVGATAAEPEGELPF